MYYQRVCSGWTQCKENIMQNQRHQRFTVILITGVNIIESNLSPNSFEVPSMHFWCNILTFHCVWCSILETALSDFVFLSFYSVTCKLFYLKKTFITKKQHLLWSKFFILIINNVKWALKFCEICSAWNRANYCGYVLHECELFVWTFCVVKAFSLNTEDPMNLGHWIYRGGGHGPYWSPPWLHPWLLH